MLGVKLPRASVSGSPSGVLFPLASGVNTSSAITSAPLIITTVASVNQYDEQRRPVVLAMYQYHETDTGYTWAAGESRRSSAATDSVDLPTPTVVYVQRSAFKYVAICCWIACRGALPFSQDSSPFGFVYTVGNVCFPWRNATYTGPVSALSLSVDALTLIW